MSEKTIGEWQREIGDWAEEKGWRNPSHPFGETIALMHSELSEALEEWRAGNSATRIYSGVDGKPEGVPVELGDCVIRIFDFCDEHGIDLEWAIQMKMEYNRTRPYRHGKVA